jgi:hypothetical protein
LIEILAGFPDAVLAVSARGRVTAEDYREILQPAVDDKLSRHDRLRLFYHLGPAFTRFTTTAPWDDARLGFHHLRDFERVAVVSEIPWVQRLAATAGRSLAAEVRVYGNAELAAARDWISAGYR